MAKRRRRRRNWSDDEKRMVCAQTRMPGVSVSQVARRYDVNANQVFNWLKDPKFAGSPDDGDLARFLPVEVIEPGVDAPEDEQTAVLDIELANGHRLTVRGPYDAEALATLIRKLSA
ncbi:MAG: transposase [Pseudomonadota bacterium]